MSSQDRRMAALARSPGSGCLCPAWPASLSMHWPRLKGHRGVNVELERPSGRMRDLIQRQAIEQEPTVERLALRQILGMLPVLGDQFGCSSRLEILIAWPGSAGGHWF